MFETLTQKLDTVLHKLRGQGRISETNIAESLREVRLALLDADVNIQVVKDFIDTVQKKSLGQEVITSLSPGQLIVKIIYDELVKLLGTEKEEIQFSTTPPSIIMVVGLQGSGKTTFSGKLANLLKSKGKNPLLVAADTYRPAAIDQLETLGKTIDVPVFTNRKEKPLSIAKQSIDHARSTMRDVVIIDTAGRLAIDEEMMQEVESIKKSVQPDEILFVVDAMIGQDAVTTAKIFNERINFDGVVLTKLDGDTRGGAALSIRSIVQKPIKFIGVGEKLDALELFYPERMASRILGMGDIVSLVEKAQEKVDKEKAEKLEKKLQKSEFTLEDFYDQLQEIKKMGPISQLMGMIPGMSKVQLPSDADEKSFKSVEAIIQSMTLEERQKPNIINGSRRKRIAMGSGTNIQEVNQLLKQFSDMQKLLRNAGKGKNLGKMFAQQFKK